MSKKLKWILAIAIGLLLALFAYAAAGPYLAVNGIRNLVASNRYDELWRFVDFDRLREDLRPQVQERIARGIIGRVSPGHADKAVGELTAMVAKPAVAAMVSPPGISMVSGLARTSQARSPRETSVGCFGMLGQRIP